MIRFRSRFTFGLLLVLAPLLGGAANELLLKGPVLPPDSEVISRHDGQVSPRDRLPNRIRVMVWNILKAERESWSSEFIRWSADRNLILLQESLLSPTVKDAWFLSPDHHHIFAASFLWEKKWMTGVSTGSTAETLSSHFLRSPDREPFTRTPKMTLRTEYTLSSGQRLRVYNTHALNFVDDAAFERQLQEVAADLAGWSGSVIWAGDFNTSDDTRMNILIEQANHQGLVRVPTNDKPAVQNLDHIFTRGCLTLGATDLDTEASDHPILLAEFYCE